MKEIFEMRSPQGSSGPDRQEYLALLMKCRDSMLEVVRLTGENVELSQKITILEGEVERLQSMQPLWKNP
jgi:hypothetical protein